MTITPSYKFTTENQEDTQGSLSSIKYRKIREVLADAFAFIRSVEANQAFAAVTLEELMGDQIQRNGDTQNSNTSQYSPYAYDPNKPAVASESPTEMANFLGGSDTGGPTKIARILAITNELSSLVTELKKTDPLDIAEAEEYAAGLLDRQPGE